MEVDLTDDAAGLWDPASHEHIRLAGLAERQSAGIPIPSMASHSHDMEGAVLQSVPRGPDGRVIRPEAAPVEGLVPPVVVTRESGGPIVRNRLFAYLLKYVTKPETASTALAEVMTATDGA